jgi:hypothetical protein
MEALEFPLHVRKSNLLLDRLVPHLQPDDRVERQHMRPLIVANNSGYGCAVTMR